ncbi:MAG: endonuclease/exonuclease/phosphatase family protein [Saprospiraceae bacterium]|nr:endonuclease/exonuclease/phosphatase family protein [Saprospiraceae bacterium]
MGIISKYPLEDTGYEYFTNNANGILWGTVQTPYGPLAVYSFHLQSNRISGLADQIVHESSTFSLARTIRTFWSMLEGYKNAALIRTDQGQRINQLVKAQTLPFILGGDLNDVPQSNTYHLIRKGMQDAFKASGRGLGITYAGHLPSLRIDYVFAGPSIDVKSNFVGEKTFSDHYPVVAKISMPK